MKRITIIPSEGKKCFVVTTVYTNKIEVSIDEKTDEELSNELDDYFDEAVIPNLKVGESYRTSDGFQIVTRVK